MMQLDGTRLGMGIWLITRIGGGGELKKGAGKDMEGRGCTGRPSINLPRLKKKKYKEIAT